MAGITNPIHLAFIAMIALIFLGPKRLPDLAKSLGSGMREFRDSLSSDHHDEPAHLPGIAPEGPDLVAADPAPPAPAPIPAAAPVPAAIPATHSVPEAD